MDNYKYNRVIILFLKLMRNLFTATTLMFKYFLFLIYVKNRKISEHPLSPLRQRPLRVLDFIDFPSLLNLSIANSDQHDC